ncbi:MAG: hypothetical protein PUB19_08720 [Lachnospiraceae bacterium]|nr:hypothetical protein [Lachnospiraceae bacterium]
MRKKRLYSVIVIVLLVVCGFAASFGSGVKIFILSRDGENDTTNTI